MGEPSNYHPGLTNGNGGSPIVQLNNALPKRPVSQIVANEIRRAILPSPDFHKSPEAFVLECSLREILNPERVQDVLDEIHEHHPDRPTISIDAIFDTSRGTERLKTLATLVSMKKTKRLYDFIEFNIWDEHLPVTDSSDVFQKWSETTCDGFVAKQYLFLAPVIDFECMEHKVFHSSIRMPFLNPLVGARKGAQGEVYKVRIHQDYQKWGQRIRCDDHYAVKRFTADLTSFNQEREALLRFSHPNTGHESLIQLLYSYELRSTKYLIFPCAESDLEYHWANHKADPTSRDDLIWVLQQCHGIASGLERVHNNPSFRVGDIGGSRSRGRHGDIKPRNILFFKDENKPPGRLVVADFTLMRFHSSNADYTQIQNIGFSATYRPPEKAAGEGTQVSQKYDIWTLGCVFLEFISWHLLGPAAVRPRKEGYERGFVAPDGKVREDFGTSRQRDDDAMAGCQDDKFFNINNWTHAPTAVVKLSVLEWINYLHHHQSSSPALHAFLDLIQYSMLLAKPEDRCSMLQATTAMGKILHTAKSSPTYCQPLQNPNPIVTDTFPHLLRSSDWYWPSVVCDLPPPQPFTADPHNSDYNVLASIILSPDPKSTKSEGELEVKRGGSSLGRPSNSFRTGSPDIPRESVEYGASFTVTPATTRQPSVLERASDDIRRAGLAEGNGRVGLPPDLKIFEQGIGNARREDDVTDMREAPIRNVGRRQAMKARVRTWKEKIKSGLDVLTWLIKE